MPRTKKHKINRGPVVVLFIFALLLIGGAALVSSNTLKIKIINASQETDSRASNFKELTVNPSYPVSSDTILGNKKTVLFFSSSWCGSCGVYLSELNEEASQYDNINFFEVNIEDNRDLANKYEVALTPTLVFIDGNLHTTVSDIALDQIQDTILRFSLRSVDAI